MLDELSELIDHFKTEKPSRFAKPPEDKHIPFFSAEKDHDYALYEKLFFEDKALDRRTIELTPEEVATRKLSLRKILEASFRDAEKGRINSMTLSQSIRTLTQQCVTLGLTNRERFNLSHSADWKREVLSPTSPNQVIALEATRLSSARTSG